MISYIDSFLLPAVRTRLSERSQVLLPDDAEVDLHDDKGEDAALAMLCDGPAAFSND